MRQVKRVNADVQCIHITVALAMLTTGVCCCVFAVTGEVHVDKKQRWMEIATDTAAEMCLMGPAGDDAMLPVVYVQPAADVIVDDADGACRRKGSWAAGLRLLGVRSALPSCLEGHPKWLLLLEQHHRSQA